MLNYFIINIKIRRHLLYFISTFIFFFWDLNYLIFLLERQIFTPIIRIVYPAKQIKRNMKQPTEQKTWKKFIQQQLCLNNKHAPRIVTLTSEYVTPVTKGCYTLSLTFNLCSFEGTAHQDAYTWSSKAIDKSKFFYEQGY